MNPCFFLNTLWFSKNREIHASFPHFGETSGGFPESEVHHPIFSVHSMRLPKNQPIFLRVSFSGKKFHLFLFLLGGRGPRVQNPWIFPWFWWGPWWLIAIVRGIGVMVESSTGRGKRCFLTRRRGLSSDSWAELKRSLGFQCEMRSWRKTHT